MVLTFVTCGPTRKVSLGWSEIGEEGKMVQVMNDTLDLEKFRMVCAKDTVSSNLENWLEMGFYSSDYMLTKQWIYIKETDTSRIYVLTMTPDSLYILDIRDVINGSK